MTETPIHHEHSEGNPDQHAGGPAVELFSEVDHPTHKHDHDPAHDNSPEAVKKEIRRYLLVFLVLGILTVVTVAISYLHLPKAQAIALGLAVATVKASLVAAFFMHLISERKLIYAVLVLTVFFFSVMMWGPWHHRYDAQNQWPGYDVNASQPKTTTQSDTHGSGH